MGMCLGCVILFGFGRDSGTNQVKQGEIITSLQYSHGLLGVLGSSSGQLHVDHVLFPPL